jgi:ABC-2 type transport system permease protein
VSTEVPDSPTTPPPDVRLGASEAVRLVASRELTTRLRSKAFLLTTLLTLVVLVAFAVVMKFVNDSGADARIGLTSQNEPLAAALRVSAEAVGETVATKTVTDEAAGRQQVRDGDLDALLVGDGRQLRIVVKKDLDENLRNGLDVLARQLALDQQIAQLGGDPAQINQVVATASVDVQSLEKPYEYQTQQLVLGMIAGILIYLSLMLNGQSVAQGVVEEKSSRVVELLLSTIRPWELMAGKVLGIGTVGLIQMLVVGTVGVAAGLGTGVLTISLSAATSTVVWLVVWYLLGFFIYALAFAAVAALVSRQEDVGGVVTPVLMFVVIGYVLGISILPANPDSSMIELLSIIPVFAPTLMPMRLAMGGVPAWEAAVSVSLVIALIPALVWLSGRVYRNAVMRTGARVRLVDALRGG